MTVGRAHRFALLFTAALPLLGLLSGSTLLMGATLATLLTVLIALPSLHRSPRTRARIWTVHGLTLLGLVAAISIFSRAPIDAGLCVVMLGLFNRLLLRAGQRDDLIIVGSAGVLLAAATVVTPGFAFAFLVLGFVPAALWTMLTASILGLAERSSDPVTRAASHRRLAARPVPALRGAVTGWGLVLMLVGYAAVSFLPRFRFGHLLTPGSMVSFSGAGSEMRLDTGGVQAGGGGSVVLRVKPSPEMDAADLEGLYARVYALDEIQGANFVDSRGPIQTLEPEDKAKTGSTVQVILQRQVGRREPHPIAVLGRNGPSKVFLRRPERYASGTWVTRVPQASLDIRYEASLADAPPPQLPEDPVERRTYEERFLQLPDDLDPRVPVLALQLAAGLQDRRAISNRVLGHFGRGFRYTLDPIEGTSSDPLARFLFEAKQGHCELYAGALAVLLRAAGVPARVAAGYYGGWFNRRSRHLELGSEDAHAWVEVLLDDRWHWVDATPADARARRQHKRFAWIRDLWDAAEALWYEHVIDFDEQRRQRMIATLGAGLRSSSGDMLSWLGRIPGGRVSSAESGRWQWLLGALVLLGAILGWALRWRRRGLERLGERLRRCLDPDGARRGRPLGIIADEQPDGARWEARRAVGVYEAARFGAPDTAPSILEVKACLLDLERALKPLGRARDSGGRSLPR